MIKQFCNYNYVTIDFSHFYFCTYVTFFLSGHILYHFKDNWSVTFAVTPSTAKMLYRTVCGHNG